MSLVANTILVRASMTAKDRKAVTGFTPVEQTPLSSFSGSPSATTYNYVYITSATLAANTNTTIDLYAFTTATGQSVTAAVRLAGYMVEANLTNTSNTGGILRVGQAAANTATLFMGGTTPYVEAPVGAVIGACVFVMSGSHEAMTNTARNMLVRNSGTNSIDYSVFALVGQ